jgi:hypothetical protein
VNLDNFRTFVSEIPKSRQTTTNNRFILKDITIDGCRLLSAQISTFILLLWQLNPQSELTPTASKIPQQRRMRYSSRDFQVELSRCQYSSELYTLLCNYWPCSCGKNHDKMLGGCMNIMLCLHSRWTHSKRTSGEFDLLFRHDMVPLYCSVSIQTER